MRRRRFLPVVGLLLSSCSLLPANYGLPPGQESGSLAYRLQTRKTEGTPREIDHLVTGTLNENSYIWQPWFVATQATANVTQEFANGGTTGSSSTILTGSGTAAILPRSSFPAVLTVSRTDSRVNGTIFSRDQVNNRVAYNQSALLPDALNLNANLGYEDTTSSDLGSGDAKNGSFDVDKRFENSTVGLSLRHNDSRFRASTLGFTKDQTDVATLRHFYRLWNEVNVQSSSSLLHSTDLTPNSNSDITSLQGVSTAQWRPSDRPFTVNGALRTLTQDVKLSGLNNFDTSTQLATGIAGINYPLAERLTANAGVTGTVQSLKTQAGALANSIPGVSNDKEVFGVLGGLNYYSLTSKLMGFDYGWNAAANALSEFGSVNGSGQSFSTSAVHHVTRAVGLPYAGEVVFGASEAGRVTYSQTGDATPGISHTVSLTKSVSKRNVQTYIRGDASDSREFGGPFASTAQIFNLQVTRQEVIDVSRYWLAAFTFQSARQTFSGLDSGFVTSAGGTALYSERDVFGVRDLSFLSDLSVNAIGLGRQADPRPFGDHLLSQWRNRLDYRIGKVMLSLETNVFRRDGKYGDITLFEVRRFFNNY